MNDDRVRITYWVQDTQEFGRWVSTTPMSREDAKITLERHPNFFPRGYVDEGEQE